MPSPLLVVNCGSSSVKLSVIDGSDRHLNEVAVTGIGTRPLLEAQGRERAVESADAAGAVVLALDELIGRGALPTGLVAVGHRVAHGGAEFTAPVVIDAAVESAIESLVPFSPLHNAAALAGIRAARARLPALPHVAVFDTAFHATLPRRAREYALPRSLTRQLGLRRYGFHGTSHAFVADAAARYLDTDPTRLRLVTCHLGAGASVTAVEYGRSVDTSMGLTPLEGLVMATRPGDLDPGVVVALLRAGLSTDQLEHVLNHESGLVGLTGSADMREVEARAAAGDDDCRVALVVYAHRVRKYIGAYAAVMGGVDAIVFTGGVGEHSAAVRRRIAERLEFLGAEIDDDRNADAAVNAARRVAEISTPHARCALLVVATDEAVAIARAARRLLAGVHEVRSDLVIPVAISVRHVHLSHDSVARLFGPGRTLTPAKALSQPGQFAAAERVTLVGPGGRIADVGIVGPERQFDQVEVSRTDEFRLGIDAPVRESGDLERTPGIRIEGPAGAVTLPRGVICALRHIHMSPDDALRFGLANGDKVDVHVGNDARGLTFSAVRVRVAGNFLLEMHVDTDEANAAGIDSGTLGVLEPAAAGGALLRRH